jgi:hypothetical protein
MASIPNGANGHGTHEIVQTLSEITPESFANDGERIQILTAVYALVARLETPWDFVLRLCMGQVCASRTLSPKENS